MSSHHRQGPCPSALCPLVTRLCSFLQLVSDTRRLSDIQWFREAYGAMTQTVRVVASEQSRQQRGWEFTPGEPRTAFVPAPRLRLCSSWQAVGDGAKQGKGIWGLELKTAP